MKKDVTFVLIFALFIVAIWYFVYHIGSTPVTPADGGEKAVDTTVKPEGDDTKTPPITNTNDNKKMTTATLHTNMGDITIELNATAAPKTVENFVKLAGSNFYDGVKFHRVIKDFMNQAGDPLSKDNTKADMWGTGGPGYKFADEINASSDLYTKTGYDFGVVAMANAGPNTNGSQFFIMATKYPLPPSYTIFGKVTTGLDVVTKINNTPTGPNDRPISPVIINSITLK